MFTYCRFILIFMLGLFVALPAFSEGNIGITVNQVTGDNSGGLVGDYKITRGITTFEVDGQLQAADIYRGNLDMSLTFGTSAGLKLSARNVLKGYELTGLGRSQQLSASFTFQQAGMNFDVGIGGANAAPWAKPDAFKTLVAEGFDPATIEGLGLEGISPAPAGLPFKDGSSLNALIATGLERGGVEIGIRAIVELAGEGDKMHQLITNFSTGRDLTESMSLNLGFELGLALYQELIHYDTAGFLAFVKKFR